MNNMYGYFKDGDPSDPRVLGLAMVPGNHIVSIEVDTSRDEEPKYTSEEEDATDAQTGE